MQYKALKAVGFELFGPIVGLYHLWLQDQIDKAQADSVYFIGREGFHLRQIAQHACRLKRSTRPQRFEYLTTSRAFLFKLLLGDDTFIDLALKHPFKGTAEDFYRYRFGLSREEISQLQLLGSGASLLMPTIDLSRDKQEVKRTLAAAQSKLKAFVAPKRLLYDRYLESIGFNGQDIFVVDIGFAGSIQTAISALWSCNTHGWYMFKSGAFAEGAPKTLRVTGDAFWTDSASFGAGDPLVDWSLILETVLTAPTGQLIDVEPATVSSSQRQWNFLYGPNSNVQRQFHLTYAIVDGIRDYMDAVHDSGLSVEEAAKTLNARNLYELSLRYDRSDGMRQLLELAEIDDGISGFGFVNPFQLLKIIP